MARPSATIKVFCRAETIQDTANMLRWVIGHRVEIADAESDGKIASLFIFTDVEYYENDTTLLERLGFDMIGKIKGVVSWEVLPRDEEEEQRGEHAPLKTVRHPCGPGHLHIGQKPAGPSYSQSYNGHGIQAN